MPIFLLALPALVSTPAFAEDDGDMVYCVQRTCKVDCDADGNCTETCFDLYVPCPTDTNALADTLLVDAATLTMDTLSLKATPDYLVIDGGLDTLAAPITRSGVKALVPAEAYDDVLDALAAGDSPTWTDPDTGKSISLRAFRSGSSYKLYAGRTFYGVLTAE